MTVLPIILLAVAFIFFVKKFTLTDKKTEEIALTLKEKKERRTEEENA